MKNLVLVLIVFASVTASATNVRGYVRRDGTYVQPYDRTAPNNTQMDNYNAQGVYNPYTGRTGTKVYSK